jgi:addiction module RelE/StbE family toxin
MKIYYSTKFAKEYKRLSTEVKKEAEKKEKLFRQDPFNPKLKTHKLTGQLKSYWSFSIDFEHRIIFEFAHKKEVVWFHSVGGHEIYR